MMWSRRLLFGIVCLLALGMDGLGPRRLAAAVNAPSVGIRRNPAIHGAALPGDFNGDGIVDIVSQGASTSGWPSIFVALGKGDGSFGAPMRSPYWHGTVLATGDFNEDGKLDVVISAHGPGDGIYMLPGRGDGTFGTADPLDTGALDVVFAVTGDFNNDGHLDVAAGVLGEGGDDAVLLFAGRGDGAFPALSARLFTGTDSGPSGAAVADLDGDGRADLAVANHNAHTISIFLNQGAFTFSAAEIPLDRAAYDVAAADVNRDGKPDLIVAAATEAPSGG